MSSPDAGGLSPRAPTPEGLNAEFYAHAAGGVLHLQRCVDCGRFRHPPRYVCSGCACPRYEWVASPGRGALFTWTVTHRAYDRGWQAAMPYATVVVALSEGVRFIGAFGGPDLGALRPGSGLVAEVDTERFGFPFVTFVLDPGR